MNYRRLLRVFLAGMLCAALLAVPRLPGGGQLGLGGPAAAQEAIDVDYFYDKLDPYGQWVWHPRFGYVWLPGNVSENWRPYTVGHWVYTDEYGWYWNSYEPFAWAVYHYGRWGYDQDYGWFWVPGDTWAPAWVQWRYSDNYTGWAPIGPSGSGYAYGAPVDYDPPVAESWVFVQPRYMTSRTIYHYALPVADLNIAFLGATNVYRPVFRSGVVFNFGIPRERVVKYVTRPIVVQKIVKVTNTTVIYKNGRRVGGGGGIHVFAPDLEKGAKPKRDPKRFAQSQADFKARAKLKATLKGDAPKGLGPSAAKVIPVAKEEPEGYKPKRNSNFGNLDTDTGKAVAREKQGDKDNGRNEAKGDAQGRGKLGGQGGGQGDEKETAKGDAQGPDKHGTQGKDRDKDIDKDTARGDAVGHGKPGGQGDNKGQANAVGDQDGSGKGKKPGGPGMPGGSQGAVGGVGAGSANQGMVLKNPGSPDQQDNGQGGGGKKGKDKEVGAREPGNQGGDQGDNNGPGGKGKNKAGAGQGGNGQGQKNAQGGNGQGGATKADKCKKHPELPACKNQ